jgi:hypothetical protein
VIALQTVVSVFLGSALGWYGHKANLRIQAWGVKMNEQDHILEDLTDPEEMIEFQRGYSRSGRTTDSATVIGKHPLPMGAATK